MFQVDGKIHEGNYSPCHICLREGVGGRVKDAAVGKDVYKGSLSG
jgi:hypothetical protein